MAARTPLEFIRGASLAEPDRRFEAAVENSIDLGSLPDGLVTGTTLLDLSNVADAQIRSGVSLAMLFASRVAENHPAADDPDAWLAVYQDALSEIGFSVSGSAVLMSTFRKLDVGVHTAIIPFLTIALGGAAAGPMVLALLKNLDSMSPETPWITMFDRQVRRFDVREMHFGAAQALGAETEIRYAVARLDVELSETKILFFKISKKTAAFESLTTSMRVNNRLIATVEEQMMKRLSNMAKKFIWEAKIQS
jgi:hypothetical protein